MQARTIEKIYFKGIAAKIARVMSKSVTGFKFML